LNVEFYSTLGNYDHLVTTSRYVVGMTSRYFQLLLCVLYIVKQNGLSHSSYKEGSSCQLDPGSEGPQ